MSRKYALVVCFVCLFGLAQKAFGFGLNVDIGDIGQPVKSGWQEFSGDGNNETDPKTVVYFIGGLSIGVSIQTGYPDDSGYRSYGGGDLGGDMVYPDNHDGPIEGTVILTLQGLPADSYILTSYHNDSKATHAQQDPINVTVLGAVTGWMGDFGVVQTKMLDDNGLGQSTVTFTADGTGDVLITYTPSTDNGAVSKAVLNGFQLETSGITVDFDSATSADFETVTPALLSVSLSGVTSDTVTVDYNVTGGTAVGGGQDYTLEDGTLTFEPYQATPEYINIAVVNDQEPEQNETIEVTLSNAVNAGLGALTQHTYTILDPRPQVDFDAAASEGLENVAVAYIPVSLSWAWSETVTVDYNVTGGTAAGNGEDYDLPAGTLQFDPCEVTKNISLTIVRDDFYEDPDETVEITLSNPSNARMGATTVHVFTILPSMFRVCPEGDLDGDCDVDFNDVRIFAGQWLDAPGSCSGYDCADIDGLNGVEAQDYARMAGNWKKEAWPVVINELMASNDETIADPQAQYEDWIEIYNGGGIPFDVGGMWLADSGNSWQIPDDRPAETAIAAGGYLLIWADEDITDTPGLHADFKLSKDGDEVSLYAADGVTLIDRIEFGTQVSDISYGPYPDGSDNVRFLGTPTPGAQNSGAYVGLVDDTKFSHDRGFYDSAFNVSVTCETDGAEIHYTLDGSEPNELVGSGTYLYSGPIEVNQTTVLRAAAFKPGYLTSDADAQTYIFLDDVLTQPNMDPGVIGSYGSSVVKAALKSVPTLSIIMNEDDFANLEAQDSRWPSTGLPKQELPTSIELIYADANDGDGLQMNCGIEGHSWAQSKRSYKLIFKSIFGQTQLKYPFFESAPVNADSAVDQFDRIVLRASKNMEVTYAGDQWTRDSEIAMSGAGAHGTYLHLYVNGRYRGLYNATERPDAWFTSSYFGGEKEDYFATNHGIERGEDHISGDSTRFDAMVSMAQAKNLEIPANYETFKGLCDATRFADYTILFWFSGFGDNIDNNWYAGMRNVPQIGEVPPEGLMMFMWDAEYVFLNAGGPPGHEVPWVPSYYFSMSGYTIPDVWNALRENTDFMVLFGDRIYKHCFNDGAMTEESAQQRWNTIADHIADAAICEEARWGRGLPVAAVDMNGFVDIFMTALDSWGGLYPTIDPPTFSQRGGHVGAGFGLTMTNPNGSGTIYYTLDGSDPREPVTGNPVGTAYVGGTVTLNQSRRVKARVFDNPTRSALNEAVFAVGPVADNLRITEIMYHPQDTNDPNDPNTEFIELKNVGAESINLNLVRFTDGIDFTFPSVALAPGQYVVVVKSLDAFGARYPSFSGTIAGQYIGSLSNGGEQIRVQDAIGTVILDFEYKDGWRSITDGLGYSLTIINPGSPDTNDWSEKDSWRPSVYIGGSPGANDSGILPNPGGVVVNEVLAHSHGGAPDWIELYNTTGAPIDLSGWFLSDSDSNVMKYEIAAGTVIGSDDYLVFYEDVNFADLNDPGCHIPFALSENGEQVCLWSAADSNGNLTGYRELEDFGASQTNVSIGRYYKAGTGNYNFVALESATPGAANADPQVGPIVISEIMYHPPWPPNSPYDNEDYEYVELVNITGSDVVLYDYNEHEPWKFTDGIDFTFPSEPPFTLPAGGSVLVVKDPEAFTWLYPSVPTWRILGGYDGRLSNGGEKLELSMPGDKDELGQLHYIRVDRISYSDGSHPEDCPGNIDLWPSDADGAGKSLTRTNLTLYGNDPCNWHSASPTPQSTVKLLYINEFQADNAGTIQDDHGDFDDWIEILNAGTSEIDLSGMYLTDSLSTPTKWQIASGVSIKAGRYLLFWADSETGEGDLHTNFGLSKSGGEDVGLFHTDAATLIDGVSNFPAMSTDDSYGRSPDAADNWIIFSSPTPGTTN